MAETQDRAATMGDLANLAEHVTQQLAAQSDLIRNQLDAISGIVESGKAATSSQAQIQQMQTALSQLPYFPQVVAMIEAFDREFSSKPGPITPERVVPIAYRFLVLQEK